MQTDSALVSIQINDVWLALDATRVVEILGARRWVPIPDAPAHTPGVMAWRGRAVATLDIGALVGVATPLAPDPPRRRTLVLKVGPCTLAVPVDGVHEVEVVGEERLAPPHAIPRRYTQAEVELHGVLMPVLDLPALVTALSTPD